jgi:hypothetical protein
MAGTEQGIRLFRAMQLASDGIAQVGPTPRTLGIRPGIDIGVAPDGAVEPGGGGMSVTPDDPARLPRHRRPPSLGGTGKDPVWSIATSQLGPQLRYRPDPANPTTHGFVEPAMTTTSPAYQEALARTRHLWTRVP